MQITNLIQRFSILMGFPFLLGVIGCASRTLRFSDTEPVRYFNDIHPIPVPKSIRYDRFDYYSTVLPPRPEIKALVISKSQNALDVNSMDEIPASSWYIPRLGHDAISPEELLAGPAEMGPPQPPITVIRVRNPDHNPRLFVYDRRNIYYLLKFDPPHYPNIATNSSFIVNRLFWGFGYHVPEDHFFSFKRDEIKIDPESNLIQADIDSILTRVADPVHEYYKSIASRIIEGLPLGPTPEKGVRRDDPNDLFPHEKRRVLRGLRVFCALTNMCDISTDNILDMYVGEEGKGYIKHHLVDFDDAFGTHAARERRLWAGYNQLFSFGDIVKNLLTLGLNVEDWEKIENSPWKSVGSFESTLFSPETWKETHPFRPIRHSQPEDNYWAAKIVGALTREHFKLLVESADYPEPGANEYIIETLMERRRKILEYFLERVTPIEFDQYDNGKLMFKDMAKIFLKDKIQHRSYIAHFYDGDDNEVSYPMTLVSDSPTLIIPVSGSLINQLKDYLRVDITVIRDAEFASTPAQFHFRQRDDPCTRLVGVVH